MSITISQIGLEGKLSSLSILMARDPFSIYVKYIVKIDNYFRPYIRLLKPDLLTPLRLVNRTIIPLFNGYDIIARSRWTKVSLALIIAGSVAAGSFFAYGWLVTDIGQSRSKAEELATNLLEPILIKYVLYNPFI